jgi:methionine-rich copper-binding protein CopC
MLRKIRNAALAILVSGFVGGGWAYAHPALQASNPGQDATVPAPREIRLIFSENIIPKFSGLTIKDVNGALIETAGPSADPKDRRQLVVPIVNPIPPGTYNVDWHAVSVDTHKVSGHFSFKVAP